MAYVGIAGSDNPDVDGRPASLYKELYPKPSDYKLTLGMAADAAAGNAVSPAVVSTPCTPDVRFHPTFPRHRPIGSRGLAVFAGARGFLLFGGADLFTGHFEVAEDLYIHNADTLIGVGEAEIGLEWSRGLPIGGSLFLRAGYEGQLWHEAGSASFKIGDLGFEGSSLAISSGR